MTLESHKEDFVLLVHKKEFSTRHAFWKAVMCLGKVLDLLGWVRSHISLILGKAQNYIVLKQHTLSSVTLSLDLP